MKDNYSGTPLLRTPLGQPEVSLLKEVSSFQGSFCTHLYVGGTKHSVLFKVDVLISGVSFNIEGFHCTSSMHGITLYINVHNIIVHN